MRIFLFGSVYGIIISLLLGKGEQTRQNSNYSSDKLSMFQALIGTVFIIVLLPWLSAVEQPILTQSFQDIAFMNIWLALTSSIMCAFAFSILLNKGKINLHEVVFSAFTGAIGYGSSSNLFVNPFPAMLIGVICAFLSVLVNHYRWRMFEEGIWDSLSVFPSFCIPAVIGSIYSAILSAIGAQSNNLVNNYINIPTGYTRFQAGGYQLAGLALAIGIAAFAGSLAGLLSKISNANEDFKDFFDSHTYLQAD